MAPAAGGAGHLSARFPPGFAWGAATSAYQVEGGVDEDGRGPSIWDTFCAEPGRVAGGDDGRLAADHRHRMAGDVALLRDLGLGAYRFSVAWPRVQPAGAGPANEPGLDFYRSLVDALLEAGVEPFLTLYHWDLPQPLEDAGGWPARETAARFGDYAALVAGALGDRVRHWSTVNEPWCSAMLGYCSGVHAPGRTDPAAAVAAAHHLLLGHGLAVDALRAAAAGAEVAISLNPYPVVAAGDDPLDLDAARRVDGVANRFWFEAVLAGRYPDDVLHDFSAVSDLSFIRDGDLAVVGRPVDAIGINYYRRHHVRYRAGASAGPPASVWPGSPDVETVDPGGPATDMGWAIEPEGLEETLLAAAAHPGCPPLYVHENGAAFEDHPDGDGTVDDRRRVAFLRDHLAAAHRALVAGVDLRGFFVWSLLDNFEWAEGYRRRFGLVHVDYPTQRRVPKASAAWYAEVARSGAVPER
ncbi:MAG TPA: GH1 family beta-glucosidase [Acidimicrobiales bacterium]|nr:GH1 family beta-glucosidase [Acidimicrobiales bacterium]